MQHLPACKVYAVCMFEHAVQEDKVIGVVFFYAFNCLQSLALLMLHTLYVFTATPPIIDSKEGMKT